MAQPLHRGIRCCVGGSETTFELVYRAAVNDVRHGLGGSTDAQWVVGITTDAPERKRFRMHHSRLGRLAPGTGTVGSSTISELAGRSLSQAALQRSSVEEDVSMDHIGRRDGKRDTGWLQSS